jgi:RNA recognition motif-containing protein
MSTKICVAGLSPETTEGELGELFAKHGVIMSVGITINRATDPSKSVGLVEMQNAEEAQKAITILSGKEFGGKKLSVYQARPQQDRGSGRTAY